MADQTEPVKRKVAVKLIRVERGQSKTILARFEAERQAIALMDHPHIAKLLDAGTTDTGAPFFVMELVKGIPLSDYCDQHRLTIADRLNLFQQICSAVQHAHQKGIIHRDLKPTNILVESHDGKPVPKVIDFGLAKATTGLQLSEQSMFTAFGSVMGTPLYMAPEQASFNAVDVDTRADVYALGVVLYELLTGTTPLTKETIKKAVLDEMLKLIREQEAPTPSSRLSSADSLPSVSANRQIEPQKLGRFVKGELDWIVLKALSKDRDRRYETANGFARDIERFLNHEPVSAGPPSTRYRLQKFVQRNRGQVLAASLVFLALVGGIVGTTVGLLEAKRQTAFAVAAQQAEAERAEGERVAKLDAEAKKAEAEQAQARAEAGEKLAEDRLVQVEAEKKRADEEKQIAQAVKDFLQNKLLAQADTSAQADQLLQAGGLAAEAKLNPTIRELLDRAAKELAPDKIEANFPAQPLVQAEILRTVGRAYRGVGEAATAIDFLKRSVELLRQHLGPDHPDTLTSMGSLAAGYHDAGQLDKALPLYEETLKLSKAKLGPDHPNTLTSMNNLALGYHAAGKLKSNLDALQGMRPERLMLWGWSGSDLTPLKGMPLKWLNCGGGGQKIDLAPLAGLPLDFLCINITQISDLGPLKEVPLTTLMCSNTPVTDLSPLRKMRLKHLALVNCQVFDLTPVQGMPLEHLKIDGTLVTDVTPLKGMPLKEINLTPSSITKGLEILRDMKSLKTIGIGVGKIWPAAEFWTRYDKGEFQPKNWSAFNSQSRLGGALLGQKKYADAEPLLLKGYEGMKAREKDIPPQGAIRLPEALDRLIDLYTATNKPDEAKKWRAERAKYPNIAPMPKAKKRPAATSAPTP